MNTNIQPAYSPEGHNITGKLPKSCILKPVRIETGKVVREWEFCERIGHGAVGVVYKARHRLDGRYYAIKVLRQELSKQQEFKTRFLQEATIATRLVHPNIVRSLPAFEQAGRLFLPMELLIGNSFATLLALDDEPFSFEHIRYYGTQIAGLFAMRIRLIWRIEMSNSVISCSSTMAEP